MLVLALHFTERLETLAHVPAWVSTLTGVGWAGVDLFFVLSGYLITGILLDSRDGAHYFRTFYVRRVLRIFPLYYGYLAVAFLLIPLVVDITSPNFELLRRSQAWYWLYLSNVLNAMRGGWGADGFVTTHFWSLAIEEQFYLIWPALVWALPRRRLAALSLALLGLAPLIRLAMRLADVDSVAVYVLTFCRIDSLALGALIAILVRHSNGPRLLDRWLPPVAAASTTSLVGIFVWRGGLEQFDLVVATLGYSVLALFFGCMLLYVAAAPEASRTGWCFTNRVSRFLGRYSYGMYVFHLPVVGILALYFPMQAAAGRLGDAGAGWLFLGTALSITILVSLASWTLFERHFLKLKSLVPYDRPYRERTTASG